MNIVSTRLVPMQSFDPSITFRPLIYTRRLEERCTSAIVLVVIHATELPDLAMAREFGERVVHERSGTGNSGHFYIDRDGTVEQWVPLERVAHHVRGHNANSIGIELVHRGRWPDWFDAGHQDWSDPYPDEQITALIELLNALVSTLPNLKQIAGHDELDTDTIPASNDPKILIRRKLDPGPTFPWQRVLQAIPLIRGGAGKPD
jgi:N-acetylmuramoyl-L-alanine amidase